MRRRLRAQSGIVRRTRNGRGRLGEACALALFREVRLARAAAKSVANRLLAALPSSELTRLWPRLEPVALPLRQTLSKPGRAIDDVYFPEAGMVSLVAPLSDGAFIEVGVIGREGCVGGTVLHGVDTYPAEAMVQ